MAEKPATKEAGPDDIMTAGELKPILAIARRGDPVSCAMALTKEKEGVLLLDKRIKPRKLAAELKKQAEEAGITLDMATLRFGRAMIDEEEKSLVRLVVNKHPSSALRPKLIERLKKAGYSKLDLVMDGELEEEEDDPSHDKDSEADPQQAAIIEALKKRLSALTAGKKDVLAQSSVLLTLLKGATAALAQADARQAQAALGALEKQLAAASSASHAAPGPEKHATYGKAAQIWEMTVTKMEDDLHRIRKDLVKAFHGDEEGEQLEKEFLAEIESCLKTLDLSLHEQLDGLAKVKDGDQRARELIDSAANLVDKHMKFLDSDRFMSTVDENPSGIKVKERLAASLTKIQAVLAG